MPLITSFSRQWPGRSRKGGVLRCLVLGVLLLATAVALWPVTDGGFIYLDDHDYILDNHQVRSGLTAESVRWAFTSFGYASNWHPLTWLSHMLDVEIFGLSPRGHHLSSLLLHVMNVALLCLVLARMTGSFVGSSAVAALFALHPLHVESVAWISERKDVLSAFFWILTMAAYLRYARRPGAARYVPVLACFVLGLLSKPMVVTLPFVLLLLDYWPLRRLTPGGDPAAGGRLTNLLKIIGEKLPLLALSAVSSAATFMAQSKAGAVGMMDSSHAGVRWSQAAISYVHYLLKTVWPVKLAVYYPFLSVDPWRAALAAVFLLGVTAVVLWKIVKYPFLAVGWFWYLGTLLPVIGIVKAGSQSVADRYTYLPHIGLFVLITWGLMELTKTRLLPVAARTLPVGILVVLGLMTRAQAGYWRDNHTLFEHAVRVTSRNWLAHVNLGKALYEGGAVRESVEHFRKALAVNSRDAEAHMLLGNALDDLGSPDSALRHYRQALEIDPEYANAHFNYGVLLFRLGKHADAATRFRETLRLDPRSAEAHNYLGVIRALEGKDLAAALSHFESSVRLDAANADAYFNWGLTLEKMGDARRAAEKYRSALGIDPDYEEARKNLARLNARGEAGR